MDYFEPKACDKQIQGKLSVLYNQKQLVHTETRNYAGLPSHTLLSLLLIKAFLALEFSEDGDLKQSFLYLPPKLALNKTHFPANLTLSICGVTAVEPSLWPLRGNSSSR